MLESLLWEESSVGSKVIPLNGVPLTTSAVTQQSLCPAILTVIL